MSTCDDDKGLARALMGVVSNPRRTDEYYGVLGEFCHGIRNHLNCLKVSIYLAKQRSVSGSGETWEGLEGQYQTIERYVEDFQTIFRPLAITPMRMSLGQMMEDRRLAWDTRLAAKGGTLVWHRPGTETIGTFDPIRLAHALDGFAHWRAAAIAPGSIIRVAWSGAEGEFRLRWDEQQPGGETARLRQRAADRHPLALPLLARVVSVHHGSLTVRDDRGWGVELRWPVEAAAEVVMN